jgi:hypothetical protein
MNKCNLCLRNNKYVFFTSICCNISICMNCYKNIYNANFKSCLNCGYVVNTIPPKLQMRLENLKNMTTLYIS